MSSFLFNILVESIVLWMSVICFGASFMALASILVRIALPALKSGGHLKGIYSLLQVLELTGLFILLGGVAWMMSSLIRTGGASHFYFHGQIWLFSNEYLPFCICATGLWVMGMLQELKNYQKQQSMIRMMGSLGEPVLDPDILDAYGSIGRMLELKKLPLLQTSELCKSAYIYGVRQPVIMLPASLQGHRIISIALYHELIHYKRHHLFYRNLLCVLKIFFWFVPGNLYLIRELREVQETLCDLETCQAMEQPMSSKEYYLELIALMDPGIKEDNPSQQLTLAKLIENYCELVMRMQNTGYIQKGRRRYSILTFAAGAMVLLLAVCAVAMVVQPDPLAHHDLDVQIVNASKGAD